MTCRLICLVALAAVVSVGVPSAQSMPLDRCGTPDFGPEYAEIHESDKKRLAELGRSARKALVTIPLSIHVVTTDGGAGDVTDIQIANQIKVINQTYSSYGFSFWVDTIDRTANSAWANADRGSFAEIGMKNNLAVSPLTNLNLYICDLTHPSLGYSSYPWDYDESNVLHGVVIDHATLPGGSHLVANEGDTAVHEIGHFFGLGHTFQGGCTYPNDYVADTPPQASRSYGCPEGRDSCTDEPGLDPINNFMDYSDDSCLTHFTVGQRFRMHDQLLLHHPTKYNDGSVSIDQGLLAYYPFGGDADDQSGNENHGVVTGATPVEGVDGDPSGAYYFDGNGDEIRVPQMVTDPLVLPYTALAFIKTSTTGVAGGVLTMYTSCSSSADDYFYLTLYGPGSLLQGHTANQGMAEWPREEVADGTWHQVGIRFDGTGTDLIVDGAVVDRAAHDGSLTYNGPRDFVIGGFDFDNCQQSHDFEGAIDEVYFYRRALTDDEVLQLYSSGIPDPGPQASLWEEDDALLPVDGEAGERYGYAVALSQATGIVGARFGNDNGVESGAAYVVDIVNGSHIMKLLPDDGGPNQWFGASVAVSGAIALVGAMHDDDDGQYSGSAYLFDTTTGAQLHKLRPDDGAAGIKFGSDVALEGSLAFVAAYYDDDNGTQSGSVYVFDAVTGEQLQKILPDDGVAYGKFGTSLAVDGGNLLVGAYGAGATGNNVGAAYRFDSAMGTQLQQYTPADGDPADYFGGDVAVSGSTVLVGAWGKDSLKGAAYVFDLGTGQQLHKLTAYDGAADDMFGYAVALSGARALVGARYDDDNGGDSGAVYPFEAYGGEARIKVTPTGGAAGDAFGRSLASSGIAALVGADGDDDNGAGSGSAYIYFYGQVSDSPYGDSRPMPVVLKHNYPNPFNPHTTIAFVLDHRQPVRLSIFDMSGRLVRRLVDGEFRGPGRHEATWRGRDENGRRCASGTYFSRLEAGGYSVTKKMVLVK